MGVPNYLYPLGAIIAAAFGLIVLLMFVGIGSFLMIRRRFFPNEEDKFLASTKRELKAHVAFNESMARELRKPPQ